MPGYIIAQVDITDPEIFEIYRSQVPATLKPFGGEFVIRGGAMEELEGEWPTPRGVVIQFPSGEQAKAWWASEEYEGPKTLRQSASHTNMIVVEGVA